MSRAYDFWIYQQLEPDAVVPGAGRRDYKETPPRFTPEEIARHIEEEAWMRQRFEERNKEENDLNYNP